MMNDAKVDAAKLCPSYFSSSGLSSLEDRASSGSTPARALPLTEPGGSGGADVAAGAAVSEADIRALVDSFYDAVRRDDLLGPVFARHVKDWSLHLPKMHDFWSTVVRRTGRYAGRPFEAHQPIPGLTPAHFDRWLMLWEATVSRVLASSGVAAREAFIVAARRMAASMSVRLL